MQAGLGFFRAARLATVQGADVGDEVYALPYLVGMIGVKELSETRTTGDAKDRGCPEIRRCSSVPLDSILMQRA